MTVYVVLNSWGGPCFAVFTVCRNRARADAIVTDAQHEALKLPPENRKRQWLIQPIDIDDG